MAYDIPGALPKPNAPQPYKYDHVAAMARDKRDEEERPARTAVLEDLIREFACAYGTAALGPILKVATEGRAYLPSPAKQADAQSTP